MFPTRIGLALTACLLLVCLGCAKAPMTGRTQLDMVSRSDELALGKQSAQELYRATRTCRDSAQAAAVRRVGRAIAAQADMPDATWAFNCIEDAQINALCLPGGIIFVNTGLLRHVENDDQLAGVIGHEVGHALARHGAEKLSRARLTAVAVTILAVGAGAAVKNPEVMGDMAQALNASAAVVYLLPGSREQEYEADRLGLLLMAKAGYDPEQFPLFWQKLIDKGLIENRSDILKTHPADAKRVAAMREAIPEALRLAGRDQPRPAQAPTGQDGAKAQPDVSAAPAAGGAAPAGPASPVGAGQPPQPTGQTTAQADSAQPALSPAESAAGQPPQGAAATASDQPRTAGRANAQTVAAPAQETGPAVQEPQTEPASDPPAKSRKPRSRTNAWEDAQDLDKAARAARAAE